MSSTFTPLSYKAPILSMLIIRYMMAYVSVLVAIVTPRWRRLAFRRPGRRPLSLRCCAWSLWSSWWRADWVHTVERENGECQWKRQQIFSNILHGIKNNKTKQRKAKQIKKKPKTSPLQKARSIRSKNKQLETVTAVYLLRAETTLCSLSASRAAVGSSSSSTAGSCSIIVVRGQ